MPLRGRLLASAREWLEAGAPDGVRPRSAATVLLVRDGADGPEVYLQRRAATMAFAPSMVVFPGGAVDPQDTAADPTAPGVAAVAQQMGLPPAEAAPLVAAAVREAAEECGVVVPVEGMVVRGRWVTPAFEPRRYDTWFLAAAMPPEQEARETSAESDGGGWATAAAVLARAEAGELRLMPPQVWALESLAGFTSTADYLADRPRISLVAPVAERAADGSVVLVTGLP